MRLYVIRYDACSHGEKPGECRWVWAWHPLTASVQSRLTARVIDDGRQHPVGYVGRRSFVGSIGRMR